MRPELPPCKLPVVADTPAPVEPTSSGLVTSGPVVSAPTTMPFAAPDTLVRRVYTRPAGDLPAACPLGS